MNPHNFELRLDFAKGTRDPSRVFISMAEYIDSFTFLDASLLSPFDANITTHLELQDILSGSIRTMMRRVLSAIDDSALKDGNWNKVLGIFLHNAKHSILRWCNNQKEVSDPFMITSKVEEINQLAAATNLHYLPTYKPYTPQMLIQGVQGLITAGRVLQISDTIMYESCGDKVAFNRTVSFSPSVIEHFLSPEISHNRVKAVVIIKKPDYLGDSQWEFRYEDRTIRAHIRDGDWIKSFRDRQFEIKPGDALRVILDIDIKLDENGRPQEPRYEVVDVLGIVPGSSGHQQILI